MPETQSETQSESRNEQSSSPASRTAYSYSACPPRRTGPNVLILQTDAAGVSAPIGCTFGSDNFPELSGGAKAAADQTALLMAQYIAATLTAFEAVHSATEETNHATT